ncbi:MAG: hypothetical protein AAF664_25115 [Planctomycetota bacterium]
MTRWIKLLSVLVDVGLIGVVIALSATAFPSLSGEELSGFWLLAHMGASGAMVFLLPAAALLRIIAARPGRIVWLAITSGLVCILAVYLCMLPILDTAGMHKMIKVHGMSGWITGVLAILGFMAAITLKRSTPTVESTEAAHD